MSRRDIGKQCSPECNYGRFACTETSSTDCPGAVSVCHFMIFVSQTCRVLRTIPPRRVPTGWQVLDRRRPLHAVQCKTSSRLPYCTAYAETSSSSSSTAPSHTDGYACITPTSPIVRLSRQYNADRPTQGFLVDPSPAASHRLGSTLVLE